MYFNIQSYNYRKYPYIKKDNNLDPLFDFGKTTINKKDWFCKFAFGGQSLEKVWYVIKKYLCIISF